jgi:hypothetical protein
MLMAKKNHEISKGKFSASLIGKGSFHVRSLCPKYMLLVSAWMVGRLLLIFVIQLFILHKLASGEYQCSSSKNINSQAPQNK